MSKEYIIEREFEHKGYKCAVVFQSMAHRCGYVGISNTHPLYGESYGNYLDIKKEDIKGREISGVFQLLGAILDACDKVKIEAYFQCHGGITYSGGGKDSHYPIDSDLWWFGFDCAHAGDGKDLRLAYERFPNEREHISKMIELEKKFPILDDVVRTEEYVATECRRLAEQLKEFENVKQN